ncbi:hypothetical protein GOP47_0016851 [Adiantum capillus-veneris]|uniref:Uncharacterized protein n=1 Tax=Adiantum capillus-veneris TaxID=13818 RepID=A0A9D4UJE9_ADICA|nr:hypothetical protein GOP47_0016851 [Adiantum capillus-veneris]
MKMRVGKKVWTGEEELKLSKLLLAFWQRHGCLPSGRISDGFWQIVKARLAQRFSIKQIQRKVSTLCKRHLNIFNGTAREVKKHEAEVLPIWAKMINHAGFEEEVEEDTGAVPAESRHTVAEGVHGGAAPQLHNPVEDSHVQGEPGESWIPVSDDIINEEDNAREGNAESINCAIMHEHQMIYYAGMEGGAGGAASWEDMHAEAAGEEEDDSSCCIIEEEEDPEEVEEVEEEIEGQNFEEAERHQQEFNEEEAKEAEERLDVEEEEEEEQDAAPQHEPARDNYRAFHQEAASDRRHADHKHNEIKMLNCLALADLASAVRSLAEVMWARPPPIPV